MPTIDIGRTLYNGTRTITVTGTALAVGLRGPAARYLSVSRPTTGTTRTTPAKISYAAVVLEYILNGRLNGLGGGDNKRAYGEFVTSGSVLELSYFDGTTVHWEAAPTQSSHKIIPFVLYALQDISPMQETKEYFQKCCDDFISAGSVSEENLYHFCDAFYYEWKKYFPMEVPYDEVLNRDVIRLAIRREQLVPIKTLEESGISLPAISVEPVSAGTATAGDADTVMPDSEKFNAAKRGDYRLDWAWDLEQENFIPDIEELDEYVPNESYYTLVDLIRYELGQVMERLQFGEWGTKAIKNNYVNAILVGKPGTGKTTLANALAATFGLPVRVVAASKNAEEDTYQGMTKVCDGGFRFVETAFLNAYKNGGIILLEEFNLSDPAVMMGALGQAIEKPFILYEDGYKEVNRHPLCVIISTMNVATQGSREPSEAFTSRSPNTFLLDDPTEAEFLAILEKNGFAKKDCKRVYTAYCKIQNYLKSSSIQQEEVAMSLTLRHCLAALRQMRIGRTYKQALMSTLIGAIGIKDRELAQQTYNAVVEPMRG